MCVDYKLCVKLQKDPFAFNMEKFPSHFYTHAVTGVTDNYQVCSLKLTWAHVQDMKADPQRSNTCITQWALFNSLNCLVLIWSTNIKASFPHICKMSNKGK